MRVSDTELKMNLRKYIEHVAEEDIIITKNGKDVAVLTNIQGKRKTTLKSLRGIIKDTAGITRDEIRKERMSR